MFSCGSSSGMPVRLGIIGAGFITQTIHLPILQHMPGVNVTSIYDSDDSVMNLVARDYGISRVFTDIELMLAEDVDAFLISLPRQAMPAAIAKALGSGRHVFAEKPMAYTCSDLQKIAAIKGEDQILQTGYMKTFDPAYAAFKNKLEQLIFDGSRGMVVSINVRNFCGKYYADIPRHYRRQGSRSGRFECWGITPQHVDKKYEAQYDYMVNVVGHSLDLICDALDQVPEPIQLYVSPAGMTHHAIFALDGCYFNVNAGNSCLGGWYEVVEVFFEKALLRLNLSSPFAEAGKSLFEVYDESGSAKQVVVTNANKTPFELQLETFVQAVENDADIKERNLAFQRSVNVVTLIENLWKKHV